MPIYTPAEKYQRPAPQAMSVPGWARRIVENVAEDFCIPYHMVVFGRSHDCRRARWVAAHLLRKRGLSYHEIASTLNWRSHSTAINAVRRVWQKGGLK